MFHSSRHVAQDVPLELSAAHGARTAPAASAAQVASAANTAQSESPASWAEAFWFDNRRWFHPAAVLGAVFVGAPSARGVSLGGLLVLAFIGLRCWSARHIGGAARVHRRKARKRRHLVTTGPYRYIRNPLYLANSFGVAGACMTLARPEYGALIGLLSLAWYAGVVRFEIRTLSALYPDQYPAYSVAVPAIVPSLRRRAPQPTQPAPLQPWRRVFVRERGALGFVALLLGFAVWQFTQLGG